ncbi:restriction endonuclease [Rodentibacter trehalosifermentans]|uniref:site-specific DNA-methyltransferase (adenine-specific) n=1 Tax=Rodentibacter trehalosifermentans TaxID=1908263 RepID=A0A1V3J0A4_9PAST|nr:Eco57I restriction-modification methylase domain-containing protein [Rodentibacter trehalosifermentans]OOF47884.1 restriction endonuclease [Rodentibacter trehalosifermentans]
MNNLTNINYNPDVLDCLANLSNDEVFTPPELVNQMLDRLPASLWQNPNAKFLDPVCKSGVFLREIAKRLISGLALHIPDLDERLNHIFTRQLYGIAITELTALISRRSLYCSKKANGEHSICSAFETEEGQIFYQRVEHSWEGGKCSECGASQAVYDRITMENHAYGFIHQQARTKLELEKMKFDVIIGNPPYQLSDGGAQASAAPIYHEFIQQAKKLDPEYLVMIVPSRWFAGGKGLDDFRDEMLNDKQLKEIHDFPNAADCFPGVSIEGGVNYFIWEKEYQGDCLVTTYENKKMVSQMKRPLKEKGLDIFIRYNESISILRKVLAFKDKSFSELVSSRKPFGLTTSVKGNKDPYVGVKDNIILYIQNKKRAYIRKESVLINKKWIDEHKIYISYAYGMGNKEPFQVINTSFYGSPGTCCTETYLVIGGFESKSICQNVMSYMASKLFRLLILLIKNTQHGTRKVYELVPQQDFSKSWTDQELYEKYGLDEKEIAFIEKMIRPMEVEDE